jgi:prevent-host-death family protein
MKSVNVRELRDHLGAYLSEVRQGESIVVTSRGQAVARLVPPERPDPRRAYGMLKGKLDFPDDLLETPEWLIDIMENGEPV